MRHVLSVCVCEVLVIPRHSHTERVVDIGVSDNAAIQALDAGAPQWGEVEHWRASRHEENAEFLDCTLEVLVGN